MIVQGDAGPSRRAVMGGLISLPVAASLAGCSIRLERDAPELPGLKTQGPPPDQDVLLATLHSVQALLRAAERTPTDASPWLTPVRIAHRAQVTRLVDVLASLGIEVPSAAGSTSPEPTPTGTPSASSPAAAGTAGGTSTARGTDPARRLAEAEATYPKDATEQHAWAASPANRPMLVAVCAARRAAQALLDEPAQLPHGIAPAAVSAIPIARAIRPALYGFEQIAGRTPIRERDQVRATVRWLSGGRDDLGPVVGEPERTSYRLPVRVTDSAGAGRLARALLTDVLTATASQAVRVGPQGSGAQHWTLRIWSLAAADHARWGGPVAPFPGLRT